MIDSPAMRLAPWQADRWKLWSLLDVLQFYSSEFAECVQGLQTAARQIDDPEPFHACTPAEVAGVVRQIYTALVGEGRSPAEARRRIRLMPPFDGLPGFWQEEETG